MMEPVETKPLTVAVLGEELVPLMAEWRALGRRMGLPEHELSAVELDYPASLEKLCAVISRWLKTREPAASWDDVISLLTDMKQYRLARNIREKYNRCTTVVVANHSLDMTQESEEAVSFSFSNLSLIRERFAQLQVLVYRKIEQRLRANEICLKEVHVYIASLIPPCDCIPKADDVSDIFTTMRDNTLYDFVNYQPLLRIARMFGGGDEEMEEKFSRYIEEFNGYKIATTMERYISEASAMSDEDLLLPLIPARKDKGYLRKLTLKLHLRISEMSLMYVDELWDALAKHFLLPPINIILDSIVDGSLIITWLVPLLVIPLLMERVKLNMASAVKFFQRESISLFEIDGVCLYEEKQIEVAYAETPNESKRELGWRKKELKIKTKEEQEEVEEEREDEEDGEKEEEVQREEKVFAEEQKEEMKEGRELEGKEVEEDREGEEQMELTLKVKRMDESRGSEGAENETVEVETKTIKKCSAIQPQVINLFEPVTESREVLCPICLQILCNTVQVSCCGMRFCHACIDRVIAEKMHCPHCAAGTYSYFRDLAAMRTIRGLEVYCVNKKQGCTWTGELCNTEKHLNARPKSGSENAGCHFVSVCCVHCKEVFQRSHMFVCHQRPYTCPYCHEYKSTFEKVQHNHWKVCKQFERSCDHCGKLVEQGDLEFHTEVECIKNYEPLYRPLGPDDHIRVRSVLPASRWFEIGRELGFSCDSLDEIQHDDTIYTRRGYLSCMLRKWLNQELVIGGSPHHTWDVIAHALDSERVGESELAEAVRHNHSMPSYDPTPTLMELSGVKVSCWYTLGKNLALDTLELRKLMHQMIDEDEEELKMMVFRLWLMTSYHPTMRKLADALDYSVDAQDKVEAAKIRERFQLD